jgi:hypothetical protein
MYIKKSFFKKKIGTGVFCTTHIQYMLLYHHTCVHVLHIPQYLLKIEAPYFWVGFFALKNKISGKLKFQSKCAI